MMAMKQTRKNLLIAGTAGIIVLIAAAILTNRPKNDNTAVITRGSLSATVPARGEVRGEKSIRIELPAALTDEELRVWSYSVKELVAEGKSVKKGDFIAQLGMNDLMNNLRDRMTEQEKVDADLKNAVIDSTVTLTAKREEIANARLDLQYKQIDLDMARFESGAEQRKARMAYDKAQIQLDKAKRDFHLEQNRLKIRILRAESKAKSLADLVAKYQTAMGALQILSPGDGIVMISNNYMGKKITKDSQVIIWMPLLAELPDLSSAIVETYIKEIDINKIKTGDSARIVVDALPKKVFPGRVIKIANMGEEKGGVDMKVFKVVIQFDHSDPELKPGMTCNNDIVFANVKNQLLVPLSAVFSAGSERVVYVEKAGKIVEQPVKLGAEDEKNAIVLEGLAEGDNVLLHRPLSQQPIRTAGVTGSPE